MMRGTHETMHQTPSLTVELSISQTPFVLSEEQLKRTEKANTGCLIKKGADGNMAPNREF